MDLRTLVEKCFYATMTLLMGAIVYIAGSFRAEISELTDSVREGTKSINTLNIQVATLVSDKETNELRFSIVDKRLDSQRLDLTKLQEEIKLCVKRR